MKNTEITQYSMTMFLIIILLVSSCTSHRVIEANKPNIQSHLKPGDKVRVITKDSQEHEFKVVEVTDEAIVGENQTIMFRDISNLEKVSSNVGKIILYTSLGVLLAGLAIASAASEFTLSGGINK